MELALSLMFAARALPVRVSLPSVPPRARAPAPTPHHHCASGRRITTCASIHMPRLSTLMAAVMVVAVSALRSPAVPIIRSRARAPHPAMAEEKYSPTTRPLAFWKTSANVRDNPVAIGVGVLAVFSQLNFVLLFVLTKLGLVTLPPLNAFTAITNAAMEERVQAGTLDKMVATGWANRFNFDLIKQFYARRLCHAATCPLHARSGRAPGPRAFGRSTVADAHRAAQQLGSALVPATSPTSRLAKTTLTLRVAR